MIDEKVVPRNAGRSRGVKLLHRAPTGGRWSDGDRLAKSFRRALHFYPAEWRLLNEDIIVGVLLDQAEANGQHRVTVHDGVTLTIGGVSETFRMRERPGGTRLIALAGGTAVSLTYFVTTWAPGSPGSDAMWPFTNPSIIVGMLMIAAFVSAVLSRVRGAQLLLVMAGFLELLMGALSHLLAWQGPTWPLVTFFLCCTVVAALPFRRPAADVAAVYVLCALVVFTVLRPTGVLNFDSPGPWPMIVDAILATALGIGVLLVARRLAADANKKR